MCTLLRMRKVFWVIRLLFVQRMGYVLKGLSLRFIMFTLLKRHFGS